MRNNNLKKIITQKGGLMIEALAMLGLIAVVTPTMYKKSAERALEVEDINTATTMRTYMNAAETYISNNYADLMANIENSGSNMVTKDFSEINEYLPYGFDANNDKSLYDYGRPKLGIVKQGNALTAFTVFPAKSSEAIGQERAARISSLIGASGGYVRENGDARGVGGMWSLNDDNIKKIIKNSDDEETSSAQQYSIVIASTDTLNDMAQGGMDNDKYLQRTSEGEGEEWRNTMRTDLYMGGISAANDTQTDDEEMHAIRSVSQLIIGAEEADDKYGLYINGETIQNSEGNDVLKQGDAYIKGAIEAIDQKFMVNTDKLSYTTTPDDESYPVGFEVNNDRMNFYDVEMDEFGFYDYPTPQSRFMVDKEGRIENYGQKVYLAQNFNNYGIPIVLPGEENPGLVGNGEGLVDIANGSFRIYTKNGANDIYAQLLGEGIFRINKNYKASEDGETKGKQEKQGNKYVYKDNMIEMAMDGVKGLTVHHAAHGICFEGDTSCDPYDEHGLNSLGNAIGVNYNNRPTFPVHVGSNMVVDGLLAAGQLDTQVLRTASLSTGSENIDDARKWMNVDANGVRISDPNDTQTAYSTGWGDPGNGDAGASITATTRNVSMESTVDGAYVRVTGGGHYGNNNDVVGEESTPVARIGVKDNSVNDQSGTHMEIKPSEITMGNLYEGENFSDVTSPESYDNNYSVRTVGGNVNLDASNLNITNEKNDIVLSVRGNNDNPANVTEDDRFNDSEYIKRDGASLTTYDIAAHGDVLFTNKTSEGEDRKLMSVGMINKDAAVNIVNSNAANGDGISADGNTSVLMVDVATNANERRRSFVENEEDCNSTNCKDEYEFKPGTIYMRNGMVEVTADPKIVGKDYSGDADDGIGVVRASRFVANNLNKEKIKGQEDYAYKVPQLVTDDELNDYDSGAVRYDTYMVNPAYTSVMHDIKLTTRGGARLSDILPDFINKGIYVVSNSYDEKDSGGYELSHSHFVKDDGTSSMTSSGSWASPYAGNVPAPQCPPGYGRVITVTPSSFRMADAGIPVETGGYYTVGKSKIGDPTSQDNKDVSLSSEQPNAYGLEISMEDGSTYGVKETGTDNTVYVLGYKEEGSKLTPLTIQQSTWLKMLAVPTCGSTNTKYSDDDPCGTKFVDGWDVLYGFLYDGDEIDPAAARKTGNLSPKFPMKESVSTSTFYWNVFPVRRGTLEGYATVYCYFDRSGKYFGGRGKLNKKTGDYTPDASIPMGEYIQQYDNYMDATSATRPSGRGKNADKAYIDRLNDPALKYNEAW